MKTKFDHAFFVKCARRGGKARASKLTPERRQEIARMGAIAKAAKFQARASGI